MKATKTTLVVGLLAMMFLAVGCKKEKTEEKVSSNSDGCVGMLRFNSAEEFRETQEKVLAMSEAERREWEQQQGFKSYATKCEELFEELEAKGINSDEDIYNFVKENSDYFFIREEDGEKYLTSYLEFSSYYRFVDENRMLQIGDNIIKAFDDGIISAPIEEQENLLNVTSFYEPARECFYYFEYSFGGLFPDSKDADDGCDCSREEIIARKTNGNERTYVRCYIDNATILTGDSGYDSFLYSQGLRNVCYIMKVRPYKRILGVWYWCRRTITYNVNYSVYDNYNYHLVSGNKQGQDGGGKIEIVLHSFEGYPNLEYYNSITGYAATPNATRTITCSTINP